MVTRLILLFLTLMNMAGISGCSSVLPSEEETIESQWEDFQSVKATYDEIIPNETTIEQLKEFGIDPYTTSNIKILSYLDIIKRFIPNASIKKEDLDPGIARCIADQVKCLGYEIDIGVTDKDRYGNAIKDIFKFERKTKVSGWRFKSLLIIHNDKVVYKLWSGSPKIDKDYLSDRPLGPLQDSSGLLEDAAGF